MSQHPSFTVTVVVPLDGSLKDIVAMVVEACHDAMADVLETHHVDDVNSVKNCARGGFVSVAQRHFEEQRLWGG